MVAAKSHGYDFNCRSFYLRHNYSTRRITNTSIYVCVSNVVPFESSVAALGVIAIIFVNIGSQRVFYVIITPWYRDTSGKHGIRRAVVLPTTEYLNVIVTRKRTRFPRETVFFIIIFLYIFFT